MIDISENKIELENINSRIEDLSKSIGSIDEIEIKLKELENKTLEARFLE